ncbi:MAG: copper homeostasis protein CutC [Bacteroidales bacterium]|nr:copper homeostasis protein CutC [Bacteroidales bacterium]
MNFKLEICVDSVESAVNAQIAGADRVELCDNLMEGGTTPSFGTIVSARDNLTIGLHVIIRPRGGDFLYTSAEYDIMKRDIEKCGECGVDGVVIGILKSEGAIDAERTAKLIGLAHPMSITFHRAYDMCSDPIRGLEDIISAGASRLLTSGQKDIVPDGAELISKLVRQSGNRIIIMPGSGLDESNIASMVKVTGASEFHLTGRKIVNSKMIFRREGIAMGGVPDIPEFSRKVADSQRIKKIINILKMI